MNIIELNQSEISFVSGGVFGGVFDCVLSRVIRYATYSYVAVGVGFVLAFDRKYGYKYEPEEEEKVNRMRGWLFGVGLVVLFSALFNKLFNKLEGDVPGDSSEL